MVDWDIDAKPFDWAVNFDSIVKRCLVEQDHKPLIEYGKMGKDALLSRMDPCLCGVFQLERYKRGRGLYEFCY